MATKDELIWGKMQGSLAAQFGDDITVAVAAAGTTQLTAIPLTGSVTFLTTAAASSGVILPTASGKGEYGVFNGGANAVAVYPAVGESINGSSANTSFSVTNGKSAIFKPVGQKWLAVLSA